MRIARRKLGPGKYGWYVVWQEAGKWQRVSLRTQDKREAERNLKLWLDERQAVRAPTLTIADLWAVYWEQHGKHQVSVKSRETVWRRLKPFFGDLVWDTITRELCSTYHRDRLSSGVRSSTVWSELKTLTTCMRFCARLGLIGSPPSIWLPPSPRPRDKRLTRQQATDLIAAAETPHIKLFVILALTAAGRMSAILDLTWNRVDFERGTIDLDLPGGSPSNKRRAVVPMNRLARAALQEAREGATTDRVIEWGGHNVRSVQKAVHRTGQRIGLDWVSPHVLRHTAASLMVEAGVPIEAVGQFLGHAAIALTYATYARFSPSSLRDAASALEFGTVAEVKRRKA